MIKYILTFLLCFLLSIALTILTLYLFQTPISNLFTKQASYNESGQHKLAFTSSDCRIQPLLLFKPDGTIDINLGGGWSIKLSINGTQYVEVKPGKWQWQIDKEAIKRKDEQEKHRRKLVWAMRTRPLTDAELEEVKQRGYHILTQEMVPYYEQDKVKEFNDLLQQQYKLRAASERCSKKRRGK